MLMRRSENYIDFLKGNLVLFVILGHCMLFGFTNTITSEYTVESNYLFRFIYSFHMPLFMLISGYFTFNSIKKKSFKEIIKIRFNQLIFPLLLLSIITSLNNQDFLNMVIYKFFTNFWFGWAIFYYTILVYIVEKNNIKILYLVFFVLLIFIQIPNSMVFKFELIFFLVGFYIRKNKIDFKNYLYKLDEKKYFIILIILILTTFLYTEKMPIHITGVFDALTFDNIQINITRWLLGLINSYFVALLIKYVYKVIPPFLKKIFSLLGQNSYELYIIHCYLVQGILKKLAIILGLKFNYFMLFIEFIIISLFSILILFILKNIIKWLKLTYKKCYIK
ncbi:acyltransferase family protein [Beduini massiliensis]|uniref:acyltransferase family protein n=1 Tax=Beduini massiliensis TaxID=1585974 RepID=UPI00059A905F|nr:acyltransferase family protein [Beduini massiliensis]